MLANLIEVLTYALELIAIAFKNGVWMLCENKLIDKVADRVNLKLAKETACITLHSIG